MNKIAELRTGNILSLAAIAILTLFSTGCRTGGAHPGNTLFGLIHLIIWIVVLIDILKSGMSTGHKVLWVLVVFFLPLIGLILYLLIGRRR